jgi:hypothetical protein
MSDLIEAGLNDPRDGGLTMGIWVWPVGPKRVSVARKGAVGPLDDAVGPVGPIATLRE